MSDKKLLAKKPVLEKECTTLSIENKNLRNKKIDLEKVCSQEFNKKLAIIKSIVTLKNQMASFSSKNSKLSSSNATLEKENKELIAKLQSEKASVAKEIKRLKEVETSIDCKSEKAIKELKSAHLDKEKTREERVDLKEKKAELESVKKNLERAIVEAEKDKGYYETQLEGLQKQIQDNSKRESAIDKEVDEMNDLERQYDEKLKKLCHRIVEQDLGDKKLNAKQKSIDEQQDQLKSDQKKNDKNADKNEKDKLANINRKKALDDMDKETELKKLRVKKLVHDKGIEKELKALEKALK